MSHLVETAQELECRGVGFRSLTEGQSEPPSATIDRELTTDIVAAYVRRNQITADQLATLISTVHQALSRLGKPAAETEVSGPPQCRSDDRFTAIMLFASTAAGAA